MTVAVFVLVPAGLALAADSRQVTTSPSGQMRVASDNVDKIIRLGGKLAVIVGGQATLYPSKEQSPRSANELLASAASHLPTHVSVKRAAASLHKEMARQMARHLSSTNSIPSGLCFHVAGYSPNSEVGELYRCGVPGRIILERKTTDAGMVWSGDGVVVNRLVRGFDPLLPELLLDPDRRETDREAIDHHLRGLELFISFQTMPLQDAVELAILLVQTTIGVRRFSDGVVRAPGQFPSCGGHIEVAVIGQTEGFRWIHHQSSLQMAAAKGAGHWDDPLTCQHLTRARCSPRLDGG